MTAVTPETLVRNFTADVYSLCVSMVRDGHVAEDLAQDVFIRAFGALKNLQGEPRPWLMSIARNHCLDYLRRQQRSPWADAPHLVAEGPVDEHPIDAELVADRRNLERALEGLSEPQRAVVVLRFVHGLDYNDIGLTFGINPGAARMRVSRALAQMRETLATPVPVLSRSRAPSMAKRSMGRARLPAAPSPAPAAPQVASPSFGSALKATLEAPAGLMDRLLELL